MYNIYRDRDGGHGYVHFHESTGSEQSCDLVVMFYDQNLGILNNLSMNLCFESKVQRDKDNLVKSMEPQLTGSPD